MKLETVTFTLIILVIFTGVVLANSQNSVILKTEIPSAPTELPYFKVLGEERDFYICDELMKPKNDLPSYEDALRLAESYIKEKGLPEDARLYMTEKVELKAFNLKKMEIVENKPLFVSVKYKRSLSGFSVIGPGDEIEIAVAKEVLYFSKKWKKLEKVGNVSIVSAKDALENLKVGKIINKPMEIAYPLTVHKIEPGYYAGEKNDFYYPVWIFHCKDSAGNDLKLAVGAVR